MLLASVHSEPSIALHSVSEAALPYIHNLKHNIWDKPKEAGNYVKCYILSDLRRVTVFLEFEPGRHISNQEDQRAKLEKKHHWRQYIATSVNFKKRSRHLELMVVVWVLLTENSSSLTLLGSVVHLAHSKAVCRGSWCLRSLHDLILRYMIGLIQLSDSNSSSLSWPPDLLDETDFLWMNLALSFPPSAKIWFYMLLLAKGFLLFTSTHLSFPCSNYLRSTSPLSHLCYLVCSAAKRQSLFAPKLRYRWWLCFWFVGCQSLLEACDGIPASSGNSEASRFFLPTFTHALRSEDAKEEAAAIFPSQMKSPSTVDWLDTFICLEFLGKWHLLHQ